MKKTLCTTGGTQSLLPVVHWV